MASHFRKPTRVPNTSQPAALSDLRQLSASHCSHRDLSHFAKPVGKTNEALAQSNGIGFMGLVS